MQLVHFGSHHLKQVSKFIIIEVIHKKSNCCLKWIFLTYLLAYETRKCFVFGLCTFWSFIFHFLKIDNEKCKTDYTFILCSKNRNKKTFHHFIFCQTESLALLSRQLKTMEPTNSSPWTAWRKTSGAKIMRSSIQQFKSLVSADIC